MTGPWIAAFVVLSLVVVLLAGVVLGLSARIISVLARAEALVSRVNLDEVFKGLEVGASLPDFTAEHLAGPAITTPPTSSGRLLLFLDADCAPCRDLVIALNHEDVPLPLQKIAILQLLEGSRLPPLPYDWTVLSQHDREVSRALRVSATPYAYVVNQENTVVAAGIPNTPADLQRMAGQLASSTNGRRQAGPALPIISSRGPSAAASVDQIGANHVH